MNLTDREQRLFDMVFRLAAGWDEERCNEFGEQRTFFAPEWHHWDMVPEVLEFLEEFK